MIELVAADRTYGRDVLAELRRLAVEHSVLRGQVLALGPGEGNEYGGMRFVRRPELDRSHLVLPDATLAQIEGHVIGIATHGERLKAAGQHLKRGVLLYGPPGTGKTHTVRYLLSHLDGVTAFILSGQSLALIGQACGVARLLQPSLVILEDVDLIAADRSFGPMGANPLLFEVLNQIDGLGDDVDVTFILTTNRVDILERALAERPGRVDAAVEIAPPDAEGRVRLLQLYGAGLGVGDLGERDLVGAVEATEGRTATYLREVVRRAALRAAHAQPEGALRVDGEMLAAAAAELLDDRATLTRSLLGGPDEPDAEPPFSGAPGFMPSPMGIARVMRRGGFLGGSAGPAPFGPEGE
jgi:cell division protease FtsH